MERRGCCNMPDVPFTTYECGKLHRQIKCRKLLKTLEDYQRSPQGKYLTKLNVKHNLACFPEMRLLQYLLATSNFGATFNPYDTDFDLSCLGSWQNPERFMGLILRELKNDPFKKIFTPFLNKPFDEFPYLSYGTGLKWPTKGDLEKEEDMTENLSKLYASIVGDPDHLYSKNAATQTIVKRDDKSIIEQGVREAYPFLEKSYSDETMQVKPYDTKERTERARSLFTIYFHTPFDTKNISQNIMKSAFAEVPLSQQWLWNNVKQKKKRSLSLSQRKSMASVWQRPRRTSNRKRSTFR